MCIEITGVDPGIITGGGEGGGGEGGGEGLIQILNDIIKHLTFVICSMLLYTE